MGSDRQAVRHVELVPMMGGQLATEFDCDAPGGDYVSVPDLQRVLAELREKWAVSTLCGDYRQALDDVLAAVGLDGGGD